MAAGNTISVVVTADTASAAANMQNFVQSTGAGMQQVKQQVTQLGQEAAKAGTHVAGMSYYFRSGIDSIRFALAGGGERAGFYAVDEAVRGLISSGMKLSTLVPIIGGVAVAAGAVVLAVHEWNSGTEQAIQHAKDLADAWKEIPKVIEQIANLQQAGLLSPEAAANFANIATGRKKLYVDGNGNVTTSPGQQVTTPGINSPMSPYSSGPQTSFVAFRQATFAEGSKYLQDQLTGGGEITKEQLEALNQAHSELQKFNLEGLAGIEKQKQEVKDRYAEERRQMEITLTELRATMDATTFAHSKQAMDIQAAMAKMPGLEAAEIAGLGGPDEQVATVKDMGEELRAVYSSVEDEITAKASAAHEQRDAYWQEEFSLKIGLAQQWYSIGLLTEQQYADTVRELTNGMTEEQKKFNEQLKQEQATRAEIARARTEAGLKEIEGNPFLTGGEKTGYSIPLIQDLMAQNQARIQQLGTTASTTKDPAAALEAQKQIVQLTEQQVELQQKLNASMGSSSWTYQLMEVATRLRDLPSIMQQTGSLLEGTLNTAMSSVASNMTKVIEGTESWHKALQNIARTLTTEVLEGLITIIEKELVALAVDVAIRAVSGGLFAEGGYTGDGNPSDPAGVVHKGEYVMPASAVNRIGLKNLQALHEGGPLVVDDASALSVDNHTAMALQGRGGAGGYSSSSSANVNLHFYDERPHPRDYLLSSEGENQVVNIARKNRVKIGVNT